MQKRFSLPSGVSTVVIVEPRQEDRLSRTCFRKPQANIAGSLQRWGSADELFSDTFILTELGKHIEAMRLRNEFASRLQIDYESMVGWESTALLGNYDQNDLEEFHPNKNCTALRIKLDRTDLRSPHTNLVTLIFKLELQYGVPAVIIGSIYPGVAIGPLFGDITADTGRVFFDFNHPGDEM